MTTKTNNQRREIYTDAEYRQMQKMLSEGKEYSEMLRSADATRRRIEKTRVKREKRKNSFASFLVYLLVAVFVSYGISIVNHFIDNPLVSDNQYLSYMLISIFILCIIGMSIWGYISERIHLNERNITKAK